ncbi:MAG: RnfABCDGE type electron transport complex subunit D [Endomicrobiia bacterium]
MEQKLVISPSPHIKSNLSVRNMMLDTLFALLPAGIGAVVFFGYEALFVILTSVIAAMLSEYFVNFLRKQKSTVTDFSCVITGVLLAYSLPSSTPLWMVAIGAFVGVVFGKMVFGGIGFNPFNPALVGRAFLQISFPKEISSFVIDGITTATPLTIVKYKMEEKIPDVYNLLVGNYASSLGESSVILLLLGYLYLILRGHIYPVVPWVYIGTVGLISVFVLPQNLHIQLFSGGLFLGAIFMATDPVTTPVSPKGKIIFALGCGILTCVIRFWGSYPEGVCFSILLMNLLTPIIDNYIIIKKFGNVEREKN